MERKPYKTGIYNHPLPPFSRSLRSSSRRATFCHNKRPICHFELVGKSVFLFSLTFFEETFPAVNPWHGRYIALRMLEGFIHRNQYR